MSDKKYVTYEEFGAKGDGVSDDFFAMKAAHDYANENGLAVKANDSATYYIHETRLNGEVQCVTNEYGPVERACNLSSTM